MSSFISSTIMQLERTPHVLYQLLYSTEEKWAHSNEGEQTWSPFDVVVHLIHCEQTNWIPRIRQVLSESENRVFASFNRNGLQEESSEKTMNELLESFVLERTNSLNALRALQITEQQLNRTAIHPELGEVTLRQLLSTWLVHDWDHVSQIMRVMAFQYREEVGPWKAYLRVIRE